MLFLTLYHYIENIGLEIKYIFNYTPLIAGTLIFLYGNIKYPDNLAKLPYAKLMSRIKNEIMFYKKIVIFSFTLSIIIMLYSTYNYYFTSDEFFIKISSITIFLLANYLFSMKRGIFRGHILINIIVFTLFCNTILLISTHPIIFFISYIAIINMYVISVDEFSNMDVKCYLEKAVS